MSGGGAKGGPQMGGQQSMGGGKGGPQRNPGPGGNAQNNPYPPGGGFPPQFNPANITANSVGQSLGSAMNFLPPSFGGAPQANFGMGMKPSIVSGGWWGGRPAPMSRPMPPSFRGWGNDELTPISQLRPDPTQLEIAPTIAPPTPQQPVRNSAGLPASGILAKLYGG